MTIKSCFVMDPLASINPAKDTSLAIMLAAQKRNYLIYHCQPQDIYYQDGKVFAKLTQIKVKDDPQQCFEVQSTQTLCLHELDVIFMRKDPPVNMQYIYTTNLLSLVEAQGTLLVNRAESLRNVNEKLATLLFPQCCPPMLISSNKANLLAFIAEHQDVILKPLDSMGGKGIFRLQQHDDNTHVTLETLTQDGSLPIMAQKFIPEVRQGDKRILLIDGKPIPYALARIPPKDDIRANLAVGGEAKGVELTPRDYWICEQIAPTLQQLGLIFVGIDVIGDYLTEVNVTSPTCVRELDKLYHLDIAGQLLDYLEAHYG
jgi:glutathione synthase